MDAKAAGMETTTAQNGLNVKYWMGSFTVISLQTAGKSTKKMGWRHLTTRQPWLDVEGLRPSWVETIGGRPEIDQWKAAMVMMILGTKSIDWKENCKKLKCSFKNKTPAMISSGMET